MKTNTIYSMELVLCIFLFIRNIDICENENVLTLLNNNLEGNYPSDSYHVVSFAFDSITTDLMLLKAR